MDRRDFLIKTGKAVALAAVAGGVGFAFHNRETSTYRATLEIGGDFRVPADPSLPGLTLARHADPVNALHQSLDAIGGLGRFVKAGQRVTIKPNVGWDRTPAQAANTNPILVGEMVRLCLEAGAADVIVTDITCNDPRRCFIRSGIREAAADRGYGSSAIIRTFQRQRTETYTPLSSGRVGNSKCFKGGQIYEREHDRFRCPQGKYLYPNPAICENHKRYVSSSADCRDCPQAATCLARTRKVAPHQRFILRSLNQDLFEEVQARMRDPTFRQKMSERMWKCEGLFAEAKQNHGLARARYRGRRKVQIQAYLSAMVQNLKRLVFLSYCWLISWWPCDHKNPIPSRAHPFSCWTFSTGPTQILE